MLNGKRNEYNWIEWKKENLFLRDLLMYFPELVIDKYLVNTSFDSGSLSLCPEEIEQGWYKKDNFTISPIIKDINQIPITDYTEWYIFPSPRIFGNCESFVNYTNFSLVDTSFAHMQQNFWCQLQSISPESFVSEGDNLICITKNTQLFLHICHWKQ